MTPEIVKSISLYYRDGSSDKVYHAQIERSGNGFVVNSRYGRRGSTLQSATKTPSPVSYEKAIKAFEKLIAEKKGKGYTEGESGTPFEGSKQAGQQSGILPQLLNPIDADTATALVQDDDWYMQEKKDGCRLLLRNTGATVEGINRKGAFVSVSKYVQQVLAEIGGYFVLDGESVGDVYWAFDLLEFDGINFRERPFSHRYQMLSSLTEELQRDGAVRLVSCASTSNAKQALLDRLRHDRAEGVVFKKAKGKYVPGRPNSGGIALKYKFTSSATCKVIGQNVGKRSVRLAVAADSGEGVEIGNVTIPPNHQIPLTDALVEVEYLYAYPNGSLYQPVYRGERSDVERPDSVQSLKLKQDEDEEP